MARYSRRRGPPSDYALTTANTVLPGMTLTRFFDEGELLIIARATHKNVTLSPRDGRIAIALDGASIFGSTAQDNLFDNTWNPLNVTILQPIAAGIHTIAILAGGAAVAGNIIEANTAELIVIQLPLWDSTADILN